MESLHQSPTIHLYSFGYKHTGIPAPLLGSHLDGTGGGFVFDCRGLPNPFWDERLRPFTGLEAPILEYMAACPEAHAFATHVEAMVLDAARSYREQAKPTLRVAFGCTGGRHRSVWQAERLREALEREGFLVIVHHLDLARAPEGEGATER
jgi:UPF0042 nucleotide-binding protein